jgi:hypothetical protein
MMNVVKEYETILHRRGMQQAPKTILFAKGDGDIHYTTTLY